MTKAIFASDLHGNRYAYNRLIATAREEGIETVILGGDLTPKWPILSFGSRAIVPLDPRFFRPDENGYTYDRALERLEPLVKKRTTAEKHFVSLGGYVHHVGTSVEWRVLREEQRALRRMIEEFRVAHARNAHAFQLSKEEWAIVLKRLRSLPTSFLPPSKNLTRILTGLRMETLPEEDRVAVIKALRGIRACREEQCAGLSPTAKQLFALVPDSETDDYGSDYMLAGQLCLAAAQQHLLHTQIEKARSFDLAARPQRTFLEISLRSFVKTYRSAVPQGRVYLILGNDDLVTCEPVVRRMHDQGIITLIHSTAVQLGNGFSIAGYPYVRSSHGQFYAGWEKEEEHISADLAALEAKAGDPEKTIFVVHTPAHGTALDQSFGGQHYGSAAVRDWLTKSRKHLLLSGHIHEAPFVNGGVWREEVSGTLCMQPGAWHNEGLCAIVFDLENPSDARWIHPSNTAVSDE